MGLTGNIYFNPYFLGPGSLEPGKAIYLTILFFFENILTF